MVEQDSRRVVVVTRPALPGGDLDRLAEHVEVVRYAGAAAPTLDQLVPLLSRADGLLSMTTDRVDAQLLDAEPRLQVVSQVMETASETWTVRVVAAPCIARGSEADAEERVDRGEGGPRVEVVHECDAHPFEDAGGPR